MDIDRILHTKVEVNNDREKLTAYNFARGPSYSLNENLVPEQLFDNPDTPAKEADGISAVKALSLAAQQGQTIYTITRDNYNEVLPKLNHSDVVMTDIRNGVYAGKTVTVHDTEINFNGWRGTGYMILDPNTGAGAYMIGGGIDGGATFIKDSRGLGFSFTALVPSFSWLDQVDTKLSLQMAIMANKIKALIAQVNKFLECNKEAILNFVLAVGIVIAIIFAVGTIEAGTLGAGTPAAIALAISLTAMMPSTANASNKIFTECTCPSGIVSEYGQCWVCEASLKTPIRSRVETAKGWVSGLGSCKKSMNSSQLIIRKQWWQELGNARDAENICWEPPHQPHINEAIIAKKNASSCNTYLGILGE